MSKGATVAIAVGGVAAAAAALFYFVSQRKAAKEEATGNPQVGAAAAPPAPVVANPTGLGWVDIGVAIGSELITKYGGRAVAGSGQLSEVGVDRYSNYLTGLSQKAF